MESQCEDLAAIRGRNSAFRNFDCLRGNLFDVFKAVQVYGVITPNPHPLPQKTRDLEIAEAQSAFEATGVDTDYFCRAGKLIQFGGAVSFEQHVHAKLERDVRQLSQLVPI